MRIYPDGNRRIASCCIAVVQARNGEPAHQCRRGKHRPLADDKRLRFLCWQHAKLCAPMKDGTFGKVIVPPDL